MEGRFSSLFLLCLVLSSVDGINVNIPKENYEFARGDNITLPCTFTSKFPTNEKLIIISWSAENENTDASETLILTYYSTNKILDIKSLYEGRVSLDVDIPNGKANLKLSSITLADNKEFECRVQIPNDDEGKPADTARLVVLVAPSTPICKIQGKAEYGQNINLTCLSEEGSPPPTYKWDSRDVRNMPRPADPRTTDRGGVLSLYNITKDTSGFYICTSTNKIRSASCNITLAVMPPSMNFGSTAGIIGGVVLLFIVLVIGIYCCCRHKKKKKEEEYAMGVREEEFHDKEPSKNGESRRPDGQEDGHSTEDSRVTRPGDRRDRYEERSEHDYDHRRDYDDRHSDYNDRHSDYNDRRSDYNDRHSDYDDRRRDYDDRGRDYDDRGSDYNDRRDRYRDDRYEDSRRYDDGRRNNDRYDEPYDDRNDDRPPVPANKPLRSDYDD